MSLTEAEELELLYLLEQAELEKVSPKIEAFRDPIIGGTCSPAIRIRGCRGGRGAGAKSHSLVSLIIQRANVEKIRVGCFREIQDSLEESVYHLIKTKVEFLGYEGWDFKKDCIISPVGAKFIFKGLKDLRASNNVKGLEGFDIFFIEEAATIMMESWNLLLPTLMRFPGSQLWFAYNPEQELDPVTVKIWNRDRKDALCIELRPGPEDNPWWNEGLQTEMEEDYKADPDEAEHIWQGLPRKQGHNSVMSRLNIRKAMDRNIEIPEGVVEVGIDVARYGDDKTEIYIRKGLKVIDRKTLSKQDGIYIANEAAAMINYDPSIPIKVDETGVGASVIDHLKFLGLKVIPINFGSSAADSDKYGNCATEMWFECPIAEIDIPDDPQLMMELSGRQYKYDNKGRRIIESKDEYKKRIKKSPDKADGLILCFYTGKNILYSDDIRSGMKSRNSGRRANNGF